MATGSNVSIPNQPQLLSNRVAIVTGASSGIGEAIAKHFVQNGASVVLAARRKEKLHAIYEQLPAEHKNQVMVVPTDVTKAADVGQLVQQCVQRFGDVDILVNCAGVMYYTLLKNTHMDEWNHMIDVNCKGVTNCTGAVLQGMLKRSTGHIVNISSDAGRKVFPGLSVYSASKFFVEAFTQGLRLETANSGIKVTSIQPGDVKTSISDFCTDTEAVQEYAQRDGSKFLNVDDVARAVLFAVTQPKDCAVNEILVEPRQCPV